MTALIRLGYDRQFPTNSIPIQADILQTGHCCIVGGTGSGKSIFTLYALWNVLKLKMPVELYICDFKKSGDYAGISRDFAEFDKVPDMIDKFYETFESTPENSPVIRLLLIDEYAGLITWLTQCDKKRCENLKGKIANILMLGRSRHCFVWCIQQRITATLFPASIGAIDNFQICIGLGRLTPDSRRSLFAGEHLEPAFEDSFQPSTGQGLILIDGQPLQAFAVPYIKDKSALKGLLQKLGTSKA